MRVTLFSEGLGGSTGANRSTMDVVEAILGIGWSVRACVGMFGKDARDWVAARPRTLGFLKPPPPSVNMGGRKGLRAMARRVKVATRSGIQIIQVRREAALCKVVLVNGLYGHFVARAAGVDVGRATLIVRESPGHCVSNFWRRFGTSADSVLKNYGNLVFVSSECRRAWERAGAVNSGQQCFVVPNTCNEAWAGALRQRSKQEVRKALGLPEQGFVVVCVGSVIRPQE